VGNHTASRFLTFSYGHRIPGHAGRCRHLHGHTARVEINCRGQLDELGMVVDFAEIRRVVETWVLENWDHRMILERGDEFIEVLEAKGEPVYVLDGPTTAENLAAHLFGVAQQAGLPVAAVLFWESPDSVASYSET
jgi:6-pyruvoyltetrahydropterin/6-carboxytetrahydropterin synthase